MKLVALFLLATVVVVLAAMAWQHSRYVRTRREVVQDHQPLLHSSDAFHVVTFLETPPESDVIDEVRALRDATSGSGATWVYAGKVALAGNVSTQIGPKEWSAVVVLQYPSRAAYDEAARSTEMQEALGRFPDTYSQGFKRSPVLNLLVHQGLLALRVRQFARREPSNFPFVTSKNNDAIPFAEEAARRLLLERELGAEAAVVVNLQKPGTAEEQASDAKYAGRMMGAMAEGGYGPMHIGKAVRLERDYDFENVVIVYYPGVQFFADMLRSDFFQGIIGGKKLGDTQATITVPILDRL